MPIHGESRLASFDGGVALEAAQATARENLLSVCEFTADDFEILYVDDWIVDLYDDEAHLRDHYDTVLGHLHMDFLERETYEKTLLPNAGRVRANVTVMDRLTLLRVFVGDEGLYIALRPDSETRDVAEAVIEAVDA
jgi:hypothetical protein